LTDKTWEILDTNGDNWIGEVKDEEDFGVLAEWDMYYRQPNGKSLVEAIKKWVIHIQEKEE
jgi:hypothetical protein